MEHFLHSFAKAVSLANTNQHSSERASNKIGDREPEHSCDYESQPAASQLQQELLQANGESRVQFEVDSQQERSGKPGRETFGGISCL